MHKLETTLCYFRFNSKFAKGPYAIMWFPLKPGDNVDEIGRCFTYPELTQFQAFTAQYSDNFPFGQNYYNCNNEEAPYCGIGTTVPSKKLTFPDYLIIRQTPRLSRPGQIHRCTDILLTTPTGVARHKYNLPFDSIGVVMK